jgi:purine-nucleoside phosphorylase
MITFKNTKYFEAYEQIKSILTEQLPEIAVILGSGLGHFANSINDKIVLQTANINLYPKSTVSGHNGNIVFGHVNGKKVLTFQGRLHLYEGYPFQDIIFPVIISHLFGVKKIIITNVSGAVNFTFHPGDIIFLDGQITNINIEQEMFKLFGTKSIFRQEIFDSKILKEMPNITEKLNIKFKKGSYFWTTGPSYETAAEIRALRKIGADTIGMSTVPESLVANALGMRVVAFSCISNYATGVSNEILTHDSVMKLIEENSTKICFLISQIIKAF